MNITHRRPEKMKWIIQNRLFNLLLCLLIVNPAVKVSNKLLMSSEESYLNAVQCLELNRQIPYRTKVFIGINVREIRDCQNREEFKPTKNNFHQAQHACKQH